jgi:hypothetical protein
LITCGDRVSFFFLFLTIVYLSKESKKKKNERKNERNHTTYFRAEADSFLSSLYYVYVCVFYEMAKEEIEE